MAVPSVRVAARRGGQRARAAPRQHKITFGGLASAVTVLLALPFPAGAADPPAAASFPTQSLGDRGADVEALQLLLAHAGQPVAPSGLFGSASEENLRAFQRAHGLAESGLADPPTWQALAPPLGPGDGGPAVLALQRQLEAKVGLGPHAPAVYDEATRVAVSSFQAHMGIAATGRADADTWRALVAHYQYPDFSRPEWCTYFDAHDEWGTAALVAHLDAAALAFFLRTGSPVAVGDIALEHGGPLANHTTHQVGLDVDLRLVRTDRAQCGAGCTIDDACYDRDATRALIADLADAAHGHLVRVYSEDPALDGYRGVVRPADGHRDHIHVRYCEALHADARYDGCWGSNPGPV